ncbi:MULTISPECIES: DUF2442 domain-containing protein [Leptospira]|uniref:PF10387 family protein n=2 Tax=Leptospira borgpetersenii TaxID=174 RepID=M3GSI3_LEPBO|nr:MULTISPECIES: DUF2442 domain-containing protein [Leptospira]EMF97798.1 PF10387 family protein [Leptospira borgpetersenii str. 200701203]EKP11690.1 PF10387 family protein [Leptospira borgpetersenii str. 200801926]EMK10149.1 PF10387 family protein [Leptospira sp. serovar Kenya str. Sh9]ENO62899.1 PF10387 family protein [Leptospira borgpetersenii serovar Mini str. 201000851]URD71586.1 DUF2442 domain-containing protein [Leptospira borgpetersenii]
MKKVVTVKPEFESLSVYVKFDSGEEFKFDMSPNLFGPIGTELKKRSQFDSVKIDPMRGVIEWDNGFDVCPDFLYKEFKKLNKKNGIKKI